MTTREAKRITKQLGHSAIARARAQYEADLALLYQVFELTDYLAGLEYMEDWDAAIEENEYRDNVAFAQSVIDLLSINEIQ